MSDPVNHPDHYTSHPSGVECIEITEHMGFCLGNAMKYIWRADLKGNALEDLEKARFYINKEIERREDAAITSPELEEMRARLAELRGHDIERKTSGVHFIPGNTGLGAYVEYK